MYTKVLQWADTLVGNGAENLQKDISGRILANNKLDCCHYNLKLKHSFSNVTNKKVEERE